MFVKDVGSDSLIQSECTVHVCLFIQFWDKCEIRDLMRSQDTNSLSELWCQSPSRLKLLSLSEEGMTYICVLWVPRTKLALRHRSIRTSIHNLCAKRQQWCLDAVTQASLSLYNNGAGVKENSSQACSLKVIRKKIRQLTTMRSDAYLQLVFDLWLCASV